MAKGADAFRTIGELSDEIGVPQHVLRYWESRFPQLRPLQRAGNRRYYRPDDVALAKTIDRLLNREGYTIKGVQRLLAEKNGMKAELAAPPPPAPPPAPVPTRSTSLKAELAAIRDALKAALAQ